MTLKKCRPLIIKIFYKPIPIPIFIIIHLHGIFSTNIATVEWV